MAPRPRAATRPCPSRSNIRRSRISLSRLCSRPLSTTGPATVITTQVARPCTRTSNTRNCLSILGRPSLLACPAPSWTCRAPACSTTKPHQVCRPQEQESAWAVEIINGWEACTAAQSVIITTSSRPTSRTTISIRARAQSLTETNLTASVTTLSHPAAIMASCLTTKIITCSITDQLTQQIHTHLRQVAALNPLKNYYIYGSQSTWPGTPEYL